MARLWFNDRLRRWLSVSLLVSLVACVSAPSPTVTLPPPPTSTPTPILPSALPVKPIQRPPAGTDGAPWWSDTVFYEIFVRSFYDSDGNGIGDFNGITAKLDYLQDLGVTGLWLMPIHPSPSYHGYDVTDYEAVNPDYGTLDDFKNLLTEAHQRGIRVIIDLVLNHTSSQHPWFVAAQDPASPYREWYVWADQPQGRGWYERGGGYYYGYFWSEMPDLNYRTPVVTEEVTDITRFWLDLGVDGFRLDAAKYLIEDTVIENSPATLEWWQGYHTVYKQINPQAMTVGEIWGDSGLAGEYVKQERLDLAFNFDLAEKFIIAARTQKAAGVASLINADLPRFDGATHMATFLSNHDQNRVSAQLMNKLERAQVAASLLLTAPGVPFVYYGEEIGMFGVKPDELLRTPMQWANATNAGFTTGTPWERVNADYAKGRNVAEQMAEAQSLLNHYRALIHLRNEHVALRLGEVVEVTASHPALYAMLRTTPDETVLVLVNLGEQPITAYDLSLARGSLHGPYQVVPLMGGDLGAPLATTATGGFDHYQPLPTLPPYGTTLFQLQSLP